MILNRAVDDRHEFADVRVGSGNLHALPAEHVARAHQHGVAQHMRGGKRLFLREYRLPLRARDGALLQDFVKTLAVLRRVHMVGVRAEDFHAEIVERFGELNGRLAAELDDRAVRLFELNDIGHVFGRERLEIELIRHVKIRGNRFRVVIDDHRFAARLF